MIYFTIFSNFSNSDYTSKKELRMYIYIGTKDDEIIMDKRYANIIPMIYIR